MYQSVSTWLGYLFGNCRCTVFFEPLVKRNIHNYVHYFVFNIRIDHTLSKKQALSKLPQISEKILGSMIQ